MENGRMVLTTYGRSSGFCVDPIEKKPLNQFYPGTSVLSFGTAGCNLACKFCQNWDISKSRELDRLQDAASPEAIARAAVQLGCKSVAYTYNDPVIFAEYARPGDLRRVRDGHRGCLPRARRAERRGDRGLHPCRGAARVLRQDGRSERRPQGV
jgi:AmmeMemoRadiSam system radical SAM enzyme